MKLSDILRVKGEQVHTISPGATLQEAVETMVRHNVGSLIVVERPCQASAQVVGIVTERDILRTKAARAGELDQLRVERVVGGELITATPSTRVALAMHLMTENRIRHLPVMVEGRLVGIVSIGDIVKALSSQAAADNHYIRSYIHGEGGEVATLPPA